MKSFAGIVSASGLVMSLAVPAAGQTQMASVRELYASASYEEALTVLASVNGSDTATSIEAEQYRALCLLAIGRQGEAKASVRRIVERDPLYVPAAADVSPRIATIFFETRRDVLPAVARTEFVEAKALFEREEYQQAASQLDRVVKIMSDAVMKGISGLDDLRLVADGLLTLARAKAAAAAAPVNAAPLVPMPAPAPVPAAPKIYSSDDPSVTVPLAVSQEMPVWRAAGTLRNGTVLTGLMRVIINETGSVESASVLRAMHPMYDSALVRAAENWKFKPAMKDGQPVKYAKIIQIQLQD
jgi:TonB family protein